MKEDQRFLNAMKVEGFITECFMMCADASRIQFNYKENITDDYYSYVFQLTDAVNEDFQEYLDAYQETLTGYFENIQYELEGIDYTNDFECFKNIYEDSITFRATYKIRK